MQEEFSAYLSKVCGAGNKDPLLVACSGGIDSMVLCHLLYSSGRQFAIAHCNFSLRGKDSDLDEHFVRDWARTRNIPAFIKKFDTVAEQEKAGTSLQVTARDLRYSWFEELCNEQGFTLLATAHHLNDSMETFFINLLRGTGLTGLTGIRPRRDHIVRPLLPFSREQIRRFAVENGVEWREDISNDSGNYLRNRIRHDIIPLLKRENNQLEETFRSTLDHLGMAARALDKILEAECRAAEISHGRWNLGQIHKFTEPALLLHYILSPLGFNQAAIRLVSAINDSSESKVFHGRNCSVSVSRNELEILPPQKDQVYIANSLEELVNLPFIRKAEFLASAPEEFVAGTGYFDAVKLGFPLYFTTWRQGDRMQPLGMKGEKLVSDIFGEKKLSPTRKKNQLVMRTAGGEIAWLPGLRLSERFKAEKGGREVLMIEIVG